MDLNFMMIFDIIIGLLGLYLIFIGIKGYRNKSVDAMLITAEELIRCTDTEGLSKYLMPKTAVFGGICTIFGIQGILGDGGYVDFPNWFTFAFLIAFVVAWIVFSYFIKKAKQTYIH